MDLHRGKKGGFFFFCEANTEALRGAGVIQEREAER
jgi:hypothetical protein